MVKIINGFRGTDPTATVLSQLGRQMFGNRTANELNREKLYAAQRGNTEMDNLVGHVANNGAHNLGSNPLAQAMIIGSGYSPDNFGKLGLMGAATSQGAESEAAQNWQVGTGQSFRNTATAFNRDLAETARANSLASADRRYNTDRVVSEDARQFNLKPLVTIGEDGMPAYSGQLEAVQTGAMAPISGADAQGVLRMQNFDNAASLDPAQKAIIGANEGSVTPRNWQSPDGRTGITLNGQTDTEGNPLPPGSTIFTTQAQGSAEDVGLTTSTQSTLQKAEIDMRRWDVLSGRAHQLLASDPTLFGPAGRVRSLAQEVGAGASSIGLIFQPGAEGDQVLNDARATLEQNGLQGLLPEIYDPNLPAVDAIWGILVYQGAASLAGQSGRSVSDKDVLFMRKIIGEPKGLFENQQSLRAKLDEADRVIAGFSRENRRALGQEVTPAAPAAPAAPLASGTSSSGVSWTVVGE
jgi:hypothetical protein